MLYFIIHQPCCVKLVKDGVHPGEVEANLELQGVLGLNVAHLLAVSPNFIVLEDLGRYLLLITVSSRLEYIVYYSQSSVIQHIS